MNEYWKMHWNSEDIYCRESLLSQVERTYNGEPINAKLWNEIIAYVLGKLSLGGSSVVLDLCAGNGLFSLPISERVKKVVAIDFSHQLLKKFDASNIEKIEKDVNSVSLPIEQYDTALLYAGIQYFSEKEVLSLLKKVFLSLKPGAVFYIGDIPDRLLLWSFANTDYYKAAYFKNLERETPTIGNWYLATDLYEMARYIGFSQIEILPQPKIFPYHHFKFDMRLMK